ncbi:MAG TPA: hypothetical protein VGO47_08050 [Chlamydiales bacterium]|nr:hypothetical protein [Chlamydiales bacterium]
MTRLLKYDYTDEPSFTAAERNTVKILNNSIYTHKTLRINYTTYDNRRAQDYLNTTTHTDFMMLAHDELTHPYWYGRIIMIFHVKLLHTGPNSNLRDPQVLQVLQVRWFGMDPEFAGGWSAKRLHRVGFVPEADPLAFGFLDPAEVIRAVHLVPAFSQGRTSSLLGPTRLGRPGSDNNMDWYNYYVEM